MANTNIYTATAKLHRLQNQAEGIVHSFTEGVLNIEGVDYDTDDIEMIAPFITVLDVGEEYPTSGSCSDDDVPTLDRMVELGFLTVKDR